MGLHGTQRATTASHRSRAARCRVRLAGLAVILLVLAGCLYPSQPEPTQEFPIFDGYLRNGFDLGVDTNLELRQWVDVEDGIIRMAYPEGQFWGTVFIVAGVVTEPPRPSLDFSGFSKISFELKSEAGLEAVLVGLKDKDDPDDGSETLVIVPLSREWQTREVNLSDFEGADLASLYVVAEFVFMGTQPQTILCKDIRYLP